MFLRDILTTCLFYNFSCAGIIASTANNSKCGVGVAFNAHIGGIRMFNENAIDSREAISFEHGKDHIDIYSSSWGPSDTGTIVDGPGQFCSEQIKQGNLSI